MVGVNYCLYLFSGVGCGIVWCVIVGVVILGFVGGEDGLSIRDISGCRGLIR